MGETAEELKMQVFLAFLWMTTVRMTAVAAVMAVISPRLAPRYAPKWFFYGWLMVALGFLIPIHGGFSLNLIPVTLPVRFLSAGGTAELFSAGVFSVWLAGGLVFLFWNGMRYRRFLKMVWRWSADVTDARTLGLLHAVKSEMGIRREVALRTCGGVSSPMMYGFFSPVILLPELEIPEEKLEFILRHELTHFRRGDLWWKAAVLMGTAIHWFNPVIYGVARRVNAYCEISCDTQVMKNATLAHRQRYAETIIHVMRGGEKWLRKSRDGEKNQAVAGSGFSQGARGLKSRMFAIMDGTPHRAGHVFLAGVAAFILCSGMLFTHTGGQPRMVAKNDVQMPGSDFTPRAGFVPQEIFVPVPEMDARIQPEGDEPEVNSESHAADWWVIPQREMENTAEKDVLETPPVPAFPQTLAVHTPPAPGMETELKTDAPPENEIQETVIVVRRELPAEGPSVVIDIPAQRPWDEVFSPGQMVQAPQGMCLLGADEVRERVFAQVPEESQGIVVFQARLAQDYEQLVYEGMLFKNGKIHTFLMDAFTGEIFMWHEKIPGEEN